MALVNVYLRSDIGRHLQNKEEFKWTAIKVMYSLEGLSGSFHRVLFYSFLQLIQIGHPLI